MYIYEARFSSSSKVTDIIQGVNWTWSENWVNIYPWLSQVTIPTLTENIQDKVWWIDNRGNEHKFEIRKVWKDMISNDQKVDWCSVVWFEQCISRHAFVLWLAMHRRLLTQDRVLMWKPNEDLKCAFCNKCPDSHNHLFFTCDYSQSIWKEVQHLLNKKLPNSWDQIVIALTKLPATKNIWSVLRRLMYGATAYAIWLERNKRMFTVEKRDEKTIFNSIKETVGMKLLSFTVKDSSSVKEVEAKWELKLQRISVNRMLR